ncbi:hypothetical protein SS50377_26711 [Spironucleus salmonicida]|uniref:Uncharacterized protein n=1 Tax=Spironucleus salmonicida TaxID=348837 RepID=V6LY78_9EUKA|nr:hypothetical protein SS50377_26711 [Spironucleus salmonicida]|eukprot:EST49183.1 Hypothetical protein SS50377_10398 [Spironucleus salmonicida]
MSFGNTFTFGQQAHIPIQQPVSVISNDDIVKTYVVHNALFPSSYIGYPYTPFVADWKTDNTEFITGFSKISQQQFVGQAFPDLTHPGNQQYPNKADMNQASSIIDQPTFMPEKDFDFSLTNMYRIIQPLLFNIAQRYVLNQPFIRNHFTPFFSSTNLKQVKVSEMAICNLLCHSFFTYLTHHDEAQSLLYYSSSQNEELLNIMNNFLEDAINNPEILAYYPNTLTLEKRRGDMDKKIFIIPKPEKAMLQTAQLRGYLFSKLFKANINRQQGNLTDSRQQLIDLLPLSYSSSGQTLPSIPLVYPEQQRDLTTLYDFSDVKISLIITLFALGSGTEIESFIESGYYTPQIIQTYLGCNYCRSGILYDSEYKVPDFTKFTSKKENQPLTQDVLAAIYHINENLCIKCPYICCQPKRDFPKQDNIYFFEQKNYSDFRSIYQREFRDKFDFYEQAGESAELQTVPADVVVNKNLEQVPECCKQHIQEVYTNFSSQILIDQNVVKNDLFKNYQLPNLQLRKDDAKSILQVQRENIYQHTQLQGVEDMKFRESQIEATQNFSQCLQIPKFNVNKSISYDSFDSFAQNSSLLKQFNTNPFNMTKDFEFVLSAIHYFQQYNSKQSISKLLFYGNLYSQDTHSVNIAFKNQQKPVTLAINEGGNFTQNLSRTIVNYSYLLLQLNKRIIWANRLSKFLNKSKLISNCYCCQGQQQIPYYFGAKSLSTCSKLYHNFDHIYYFLIENPQPNQISLNLLYQCFQLNSFIPIYLTNLRRLPDIAIVRQLIITLSVDETQFQRTPQNALLQQQQKAIDAIIYTCDCGHFWRSDEHLKQILCRQQIGILNDTNDFYLNNNIQLPSALQFLKQGFQDFVEFELITLINTQNLLNTQYYNRLNSQIQSNDKDENSELLTISSMANNHLFVPQSYINLQNLSMSKANIYSMMYEKKFQFGYKLQKEDLTTILNLNHSYINVQRNLSRVLGSLLQQNSMLEVNQIIAHVFTLLNQQFQAQTISTFSQLQYFSLELYNIVVQQIQKLVPQIERSQEIQKPIIKSNKKNKKEEKKKKEVSQIVTTLDAYVLTDKDPIWSLMLQNTGLSISFALNQVLRQQEILQENHQYVIQQQVQGKSNVKIAVQSQTYLTYQFQTQLLHYIQLVPEYQTNSYFQSLVALISYHGLSNYYAILLSFIYSQKDFATLCNQHNLPKFDYQLNERYTGNSYILEDNIPYGSFWTTFSLKATKPAIYCSIPPNVNINYLFLTNQFAKIQKDKQKLLFEDLAKMTIPLEVGNLNGINVFYLSILSNNSAQLWLVINHYQFTISDLLSGLLFACMSGNQFIIKILINYTTKQFQNNSIEQQVQISNQARKKFNTQNQGHQLPVIKIDQQDVTTQKVVDIHQILTAYFVDKLNLIYENQEPIYWSNKSFQQNFNKDKPDSHIYRQIYPMKNNFLVDKILQVFQDVNDIIGNSYMFQFFYLYQLFNINSRYCINNSCQVCKLHKQILKSFNQQFKDSFDISNIDQCVVKTSIQNALSTQLSNFSHAKKSIVQSIIAKNITQSLSSLASIPKFNLYIVFKRGKTINLTEIKLQNTQTIKLQTLNFIPLTTPLTLAAQLYSESLEELITIYKKDLNQEIITRSYINHQDALGLTALNHAMIVYLQFADKMLSYQCEVDENRKNNPQKQLILIKEMTQIKMQYKQAFTNLQLLIQLQAHSFISDKLDITARDRLVIFIVTHKLLLLQDYQFLECFGTSDFYLTMIYHNNDLIIKQQCEQFLTSQVPLKRVIQQYSTLPDNRLKNKLNKMQSMFSQGLILKDLKFGFDLSKYQNMITVETGDFDFAKLVYENIISLIKQFCQEDYPEHLIQFCEDKKLCYDDIYTFQCKEVKVGCKVESFSVFEKNQRGEDYRQEQRNVLSQKVENYMFNMGNNMRIDVDLQTIKFDEFKEDVKYKILKQPLCELQQMHRFSNRVWRLFNHNEIKLNIMRSSGKILNNISVQQPAKLILNEQLTTETSDESVLFEYRKNLLRGQIISQCINRSENVRISIVHQSDSLDIQACIRLSSLLQFGYSYCGIKQERTNKFRGVEIISQRSNRYNPTVMSISASLGINDNVGRRYSELTQQCPKLSADQRYQIFAPAQQNGFVKIDETKQ